MTPFRPSRARGISLAESVIASGLLALCVVAIIGALTFAHFTTQRAACMSDTVVRATRILEDIAAVPYDLVTTNTYPIEYVTMTNGARITLRYALTTTVVEATSPLPHKQVYVDYTWCVDRSTKHTRFFAIKTP